MSVGSESSNGADVIIEICGSIEKELSDLQELSNECSIYRVPERLRKVDDKAYTPQVVSIGPLHYGREELKAMEEYKKRYLRYFVELSQLSGGATLQQYVEFIKKEETKLRNSYADTVCLNSQEFVKMMLIDAAFIILILVQEVVRLPQMTNDRIFTKPNKIYEVRGDILLLENQLPFFILDDLFKMSKIKRVDLTILAHSLLEVLFQVKSTAILERSRDSYKVEHLLQLLRTLYVNPAGRHVPRKKMKSLNIPCALELHQAGVEFEPGSEADLFDIKFEGGILKIPPLEIVDSTEVLFQNICAFEQCHCITDPKFFDPCIDDTNSRNEDCHCQLGLFSDYMAFLCQLVQGPNDAELLIRKGILQNRALSSSEQVLNFMYKLDKGNAVSLQVFSYSDVMEGLNKFYEDRWHKWIANLKQEYFKNPWTGISVFAAAFLIVLTITQTVCSILQL